MRSETHRLLKLMCDVKRYTGRWHDPEVAELIHLVEGPAQMTDSGYLRRLRDRFLTPKRPQSSTKKS